MKKFRSKKKLTESYVMFPVLDMENFLGSIRKIFSLQKINKKHQHRGEIVHPIPGFGLKAQTEVSSAAFCSVSISPHNARIALSFHFQLCARARSLHLMQQTNSVPISISNDSADLVRICVKFILYY